MYKKEWGLDFLPIVTGISTQMIIFYFHRKYLSIHFSFSVLN